MKGLGSFLEMDFQIECGSTTHIELQIVGYICLSLYTLGFPIYLFYDLKRTRKWHHELPETSTLNQKEKDKHLTKHHMVKMRLGSLYHSYEKEYWWFEIVYIIQKMLLVGALGVIAIGSPLQLLLAVLVCAIFLLVLVRTAPFESDHLDILNIFTSISLSLTLFAAFAKAMDEMGRKKPKHSIGDKL